MASDRAFAGAEPAFALHHVVKTFPGHVAALRGVSLAVARGERACLLGPNGAGKTTIVRLLQGALQPTHGTVMAAGIPSTSHAFLGARREMGIVPQQPGMYDDLRAGEYLDLVRRLYVCDENRPVVRRLGLEPYLDRPLAALSGGLQRRVALAAALIPNPPILILDEPTVGLDPVAAREVRALLADATADRTVLLCTHNLAEAEALCESVIILRAGQVLLHDQIDTLRGRLGVKVRLRIAAGSRDQARAVTALLGDARLVPDEPQAVDVPVAQPERDVPVLLRRLLDHAVDVYEAQVLRPTLEDLFFEVLDEGEAAGGSEQPSADDVAGPSPRSGRQGGSDVAEGQGAPHPRASALARRAAMPVALGRVGRAWALLRKELTQLPRKRSVLISAVIVPLVLLLILPVGQMVGISRLPPYLQASSQLPAGFPLPAVMATINRDPAAAFRLLTLPLIVLLGGLIVPTVMASHTVVVERERRTLDLLVSLPVTLGDILRAKLAVTVIVAGGVCGPLFMVDALVALGLGLAGAGDILAMAALLCAAIVYSTTAALVISLIAGDFRTANNVGGALIGPLVLVALGLTFVLPLGAAPWAMAAALLALAAIALGVSLRWLTVERLLR